ncbi:hypothetical protein K458DRAFT_194217 [Lentithecium fluviatile CBS 122367]|uniref:Dipeptidase n=1 Tax=Lentithecium fluviatile CBS 122367 TaxID=1168545 RepID=A0A6G1ID49_9PLEO|nr:hypothetical protein K458DRAFT_194217 [Lentithecium fluviatile CBS 122367]
MILQRLTSQLHLHPRSHIVALPKRELAPGFARFYNAPLHKVALSLALPILLWILWTHRLSWFAGPYRTAWRFASPKETIEARVNDILESTLLIDGHNDLAYFIRWAHSNRIYLDNFTKPFEEGTLGGEVDLHRLRQGHSGGAF